MNEKFDIEKLLNNYFSDGNNYRNDATSAKATLDIWNDTHEVPSPEELIRCDHVLRTEITTYIKEEYKTFYFEKMSKLHRQCWIELCKYAQKKENENE